MSQKGRGCLVADQGGSDKVAQCKIENRGSGTAVPPIKRSSVSLLLTVLCGGFGVVLILSRCFTSYFVLCC